jgi:transcriptional regulator with XRE-family HTH domain
MISKISLLAEKLKSLRAEAEMSQDEMATVMGISRMTYIASELGNRIPKRHEIENIARSFEIPLSSLLGEPEAKKTTPKSIENDPNYRFKQVLLYILSQCGQRPNIGKTIVNKLLYFADFNFYEKNGERSITSAQYVKLPF